MVDLYGQNARDTNMPSRSRTEALLDRPLQAEDIADAVCYVVSAPDHVNVLEMLILPTDQRNAFLVHKEPK